VTAKLPAALENTVAGVTELTVGAGALLTVTVELAVEVPQVLVAVSERATGPGALGAVKTGLARVEAESDPAAAVQAYVSGAVPVALPPSVTVPPEATV
jgi:hypothetical protein